MPPLTPESSSALDTGFVAKIELAERPLVRRLRPALALLGVSILIAIFDPIYASLTGEVLELLGVRPSVLGALLLLLAFALAGREALREP